MNFGTDFVDINTKTPMEHRDRLPEIYHRVASVDTQKYRKTREDKEIGSESKKNVKNVDLGTGGGTLNSSSILKSRQKMDIRTSRNLKI